MPINSKRWDYLDYLNIIFFQNLNIVLVKFSLKVFITSSSSRARWFGEKIF